MRSCPRGRPHTMSGWCTQSQCSRAAECRSCRRCGNHCPHVCLKGYWHGRTFLICRQRASCRTCHRCEAHCGCSDLSASITDCSPQGRLVVDASFIRGIHGLSVKATNVLRRQELTEELFLPKSLSGVPILDGRGAPPGGGAYFRVVQLTEAGRTATKEFLTLTLAGVTRRITAVSDILNSPWFSVKRKHLGGLVARQSRLVMQFVRLIAGGTVSLATDPHATGICTVRFDTPIPLDCPVAVEGCVTVGRDVVKRLWCCCEAGLGRDCDGIELVSYCLVPEGGWERPRVTRLTLRPSRLIVSELADWSEYTAEHAGVLSHCLTSSGDVGALACAKDGPSARILLDRHSLTRSRFTVPAVGVDSGVWFLDDQYASNESPSLPGGYTLLTLDKRTMRTLCWAEAETAVVAIMRVACLPCAPGKYWSMRELSEMTRLEQWQVLSTLGRRDLLYDSGPTGCYTRLSGRLDGGTSRIRLKPIQMGTLIRTGVIREGMWKGRPTLLTDEGAPIVQSGGHLRLSPAGNPTYDLGCKVNGDWPTEEPMVGIAVHGNR